MSAPIHVVILTWTILSTAPIYQQSTPTPAQQATAGAGPVSLIGCVERLPAAQGAPATAPATFKLIEVQPGAGTRMTVRVDAQFLLANAKSATAPIELGKFQNQRVEVTGTIAPAPPTVVNPQAKPGEAAAASLPTFTLTSLKVVSTECK